MILNIHLWYTGSIASTMIPARTKYLGETGGKGMNVLKRTIAAVLLLIPLVIVSAPSFLVLPASAQDCIDYGSDFVHLAGAVDTPGSAYGVAVSGSYAYVADGWSGLQVMDISVPESPSIVGA